MPLFLSSSLHSFFFTFLSSQRGCCWCRIIVWSQLWRTACPIRKAVLQTVIFTSAIRQICSAVFTPNQGNMGTAGRKKRHAEVRRASFPLYPKRECTTVTSPATGRRRLRLKQKPDGHLRPRSQLKPLHCVYGQKRPWLSKAYARSANTQKSLRIISFSSTDLSLHNHCCLVTMEVAFALS